ISSFDGSAHPVKLAAEVADFDLNPFVPAGHRKSIKLMGRAARFGVAAAGLAVQDSGLDLPRENPERVGVVLGTGVVPIDLPEIAPLIVAAVNEAGELRPDRLGRRGSVALV